MQLQAGGRFTLIFEQAQGPCVVYAAALQTPGNTWACQARFDCERGEVDWLPAPDIGQNEATRSTAAAGAPNWLLAYARAALRTAWKQAPEAGWPRRITRWRQPSRAHQ